MALAYMGRQAGEPPISRSSSQSSGWFEALAEDVAEQLRELDQDPVIPVGNLVPRASAPVAIAPVSAIAPWALQKPDLRYPPPPPPNPPVFTDKMDNANVSADHKNGTCDPCVFFSSSRGCAKGTACRFCHLGNHFTLEKAKAIQRPRKQTRDKYKSVVQKLLQQMELNPEKAHEELQAEANKSSYVRKLLQGYLMATNRCSISNHCPSFQWPTAPCHLDHRFPHQCTNPWCTQCIRHSSGRRLMWQARRPSTGGETCEVWTPWLNDDLDVNPILLVWGVEVHQ